MEFIKVTAKQNVSVLHEGRKVKAYFTPQPYVGCGDCVFREHSNVCLPSPCTDEDRADEQDGNFQWTKP